MSRVVLIGADRVLEHQARVLLGDEVVTLSPASSDILLTRMVGLPRRPELVLIGNCVSAETAIQISRVIRQLTDVLAIQSDDLRVRENGRSIGVAEFMGSDPELEDVEALLERSRKLALRVRTTGVAARTSSRAPGRIVSVISPKGGVGKTTVACNLAVTLATSEERVIIVDLDLQFGDVSGTLGVDSRHSVVDAVSKAAARDEFVLRTMLTTHSAGVAVLGAPESPASADNVDPHRIGHLLRQLAADFDYVIIDTAPGLTETTLAAIEQSEAVVAVGGLDMSSVRGLRKSLELLKELHMLPRIVQLVFNGVDKQVGLTVEDAERIVGTAADVVIPRRKAVAVAGNHALPVVEVSPRDPASKALRTLAQELRAQLTLKDWRGAGSRPARKLTGVSRAAHAASRPILDLQAIDDTQKETAS
jgi:pilus assembly protein CpaE